MCDSLHRLKLNIVGLTTTAASSWALYTPSSYIVFSLTFKPKITWGNLNVDDVKWHTKSKICILIREVVCYTCGDDQLAQLASSFKTMFSWIRFIYVPRVQVTSSNVSVHFTGRGSTGESDFLWFHIWFLFVITWNIWRLSGTLGWRMRDSPSVTS